MFVKMVVPSDPLHDIMSDQQVAGFVIDINEEELLVKNLSHITSFFGDNKTL